MFKIPVRFEVGDESINRIVRKVVMSLQGQVDAIVAKLDKVATDAIEEKAEVVAALEKLNTSVAEGNVKLEEAKVEIVALKQQIADLQAQQPTVDFSALAAKADQLEVLVEDIYVAPVVE